jgi:hypothetical protein
MRPRLGPDAVLPVVRAFERVGVPAGVAVQALEEAQLLPGTRADLWQGAGLPGSPCPLPREDLVRLVGSLV